MTGPKFRVGQTINFKSFQRTSAAPGRYQIVGLRPEQDGEPSYRIKSDLERHDRIARESELTWIS